MKLLGFTGRAGCGKDTAAQFVAREYGYVRYGFADPIKAALEAMFGWPVRNWEDTAHRGWKESTVQELGFSPRVAAQTLGTEWGRSLNPHIWVLLAQQFVNRHSDAPGVVFSDVRFANEAKWIRESGGTVGLIVRTGLVAVKSHVSEFGIPSDYIDTEILNEGTVEQFGRRIRDKLNGKL